MGVPSPSRPVPGTPLHSYPLVHRVRTPTVGCAVGSPADFDRLGVTVCGASSSRARHCIGSVSDPTVHQTGSDYCLIAWGGQGRPPSSSEDWRQSLCSEPDSYQYVVLPVAFSCGLSISPQLSPGRLPPSCRIQPVLSCPAAEAAGILLDPYNSSQGKRGKKILVSSSMNSFD
ncbi:MAG: hypothetical protein J07HQW2_01017 [Haloquadratum walsbyi J07HQW2]|uniref:Uncharacterized protein n=1 Tax=Haloquadratum walsbyi J07HQW2 TaxID=1238425 RepID=U1PQH3_9EURY|nr:MAG: hypothetical protein J07HQW2_01017 [Haloquadratum walsbyi J07HQW2]